MTGLQIKDGFLDMANVYFKCPYCGKQHNDLDEKYLNRCNRNKDFTTSIRCSCGKRFGMCYDITGDAVSFKHLNKIPSK